MEKIGLNRLREMFLSFYESKDHLRRQSYSLIPEGDKSLLIINSGMAPLKPYFAGLKTPPNKRMTTCQKCIRTGDIDNVGYTDRHGTFFEMLGSFSFGDYFKKESLIWGFEFITDYLNMPVDRLWASVYEEDDEAYDIWLNDIKMPKERIVKLGKEDNFWEIGTGPCGPCSEVYYDRGEEYGCGREGCMPGCDCDRYLEFWNHVFTQFNKDDQGVYSELEHKNIDTGMGLERIALIMQDVDSIFAVDTIKYIIDGICEKSGKTYTFGKSKDDVSIRIITDHLRSITFMVADDILPGNEGRGYVLRRLLRRAARHGRLLGIEGTFLADLSKLVVMVSKDAYPELSEREDYIHKIINVEEEKFSSTIKQGEDIIHEYVDDLLKSGDTILKGELAFKLYDTYGFPIELTEEILLEKDLTLDKEGFESFMEHQKQQAREARKEEGDFGWEEETLSLENVPETIFTGYETLEDEGRVLNLFKDNKEVKEVREGDTAFLILDRTPFYAEGGGQTTDTGVMYSDNCAVEVLEVTNHKNIYLHKVHIKQGILKRDHKVKTLVTVSRRNLTAANHTATHLLHKALKEVLGDHVKQAGSSVSPEGLRFDFNHYSAMTKDEIMKTETLVNEQISYFPPVNTEIMEINDALNKGVVALFDEKYDNIVRVVSVGSYSSELCGGTHVKNAGQIGAFKIISETGVASGVRRIEAVTSLGVLSALNSAEAVLTEASSAMKTGKDNLLMKVKALVGEIKVLEKEVDRFKKDSMEDDISEIIKDSKDIGDVKLVTHGFKDISADQLRSLSDIIKNQIGNSIIVFSSTTDSKVTYMVSVADGLLDKGYHAGSIMKEVAKAAGGKGGGKADMAQGGGTDPEKIHMAFRKAYDMLQNKEAV